MLLYKNVGGYCRSFFHSARTRHLRLSIGGKTRVKKSLPVFCEASGLRANLDA